MTTYTCIGGPCDGGDYSLGDRSGPDTIYVNFDVVNREVVASGGRYIPDHHTRRLIWYGLREADAIRAEVRE